MKKISDITIIDDDAITVFGLRKLISSSVECNSIASYANGKIAIDAMNDLFNSKQQIPQIIFLDINMPIMDGWEFLEAFINLPITEKIRINIVTSSIDPRDQQQWEYFKGKSHHLITFNQKPIDRNKIVEITQVA
ncbi:response regulator [Maribacter litoralis]|uniref:response regulator n=1 Tax=Maribacter litoralis TaxID=2059726 RepID=UPI003F5CF107